MYKYNLIKLLTSAVLLLISFFSHAQTVQDSALYAQTTNNIIAGYNTNMQSNLRLYNGREYLYSGHNVKGFPYFEYGDMVNGSVYYDGNLYSNVLMHYDLVNDELIINDYTKNYPVKLITDKIKFFIINNYRFINAADSSFPLTEKGFYEELYHNKTIVLAKKLKQLKQTAKTEDNESYYKEYSWYYIYSNEKLYKADNERVVLNVFQKRKTDIKKYIRSNNISFKKDFENALIKTAAYFDEIEN